MQQAIIRYFTILCLLSGTLVSAVAQDNSPYSRYGLGDLLHSQNTVTKGMGGIAQSFIDAQSVNFINPASYSTIQYTTLDLGLEADSRRIKDNNNDAFNSGNATLSYLQLGVPVKAGKWGINFGLVPLTRMSYNINQVDSLPDISKVLYTYEGSGGLYQAFAGTGYRMGNLSLGINFGYLFGSVKNSTRADYTDSLHLLSSNSSQTTSFGSFFWKGGAQYHAKLGKKLFMELGASGSTSQHLSARRDSLRNTYYYSGPDRFDQDTAYYHEGTKGRITYPWQLGFGISLHDDIHWLIGADYNMAKWSEYRFFGEKDENINDSWMFNIGGQYTPAVDNSNKYWNFVTWRAGFYYGKDYISYAGASLPVHAFTLGVSLPVRIYNTQSTHINLSLEAGKRGKSTSPLSENFYRFTLGFTLSDKWFIKHKFY